MVAEKSHVFLTTFAAEALWASTLAAVTLYCERYQNCQSKGGHLIQIEGDPILDPATLPILWVIDNLVHQQITEYPSNLLTPAGINSTESGIMVNEIARRSLAMRSKSWEPLTKMLRDFEPCRVHEMEQAGIQLVEVLGLAGVEGKIVRLARFWMARFSRSSSDPSCLRRIAPVFLGAPAFLSPDLLNLRHQ